LLQARIDNYWIKMEERKSGEKEITEKAIAPSQKE